MEKSEVKIKIIEILNDLFPSAGANLDFFEYIDLIDDLDIDSMAFISIVIEIETTFCITIPDEMLLMENFRNVECILAIIESAMKGNESHKNKQEDNNDKVGSYA